jgi:hypothetical protein
MGLWIAKPLDTGIKCKVYSETDKNLNACHYQAHCWQHTYTVISNILASHFTLPAVNFWIHVVNLMFFALKSSMQKSVLMGDSRDPTDTPPVS